MNEKINNMNIIMKVMRLPKRLCCVLAMSLMCVLAMQAFTYQNSNYTVNADGSSVTLTRGDMTYGTTIIVPNYAYDGDKAYAVTAVADNAFNNISKQAMKVVIGDNVTSIGKKAFEHFGEPKGNYVLILGKSVKTIGDKGFEHFAETGNGSKLFVLSENVPQIEPGKSLEHMKSTTIYVRDQETYDRFMEDDHWKEFENDKFNNKYNHIFPSEMNINGNKWVTAIFPETLDRTAIESWFGKNTKWALWTQQTYHITGKQYEFVMEFYNQGDKPIPANTPILIKPSNKESHYVSDVEYADGEHSIKYDFKIGDPHELSMIGATEEDYTLRKGEFYTRSYEGDKLTFFEAADDNSCHIKKGKCWFKITELATGKIASAKLMFSIDGVHTAIDRVDTDLAQKPTRIYSITGQYEGTDISKLPKGVHIVNGKKILVK